MNFTGFFPVSPVKLNDIGSDLSELLLLRYGL